MLITDAILENWLNLRGSGLPMVGSTLGGGCGGACEMKRVLKDPRQATITAIVICQHLELLGHWLRISSTCASLGVIPIVLVPYSMLQP